MRLKLWKQVLLSLLLPTFIASAIILYAVYNLSTISNRINFIEIADDINIILLELRRYEKNIILFKEEENIKKFYEYLQELELKVHAAENEIREEINKLEYKPLLSDIKTYKESVDSLISSVKTEQKLEEDIRPLGRIIENKAASKATALDLRRYEKNYIIYREQKAVDKLHQIAKELVRTQPELSVPVRNYMKAFDSLVGIEFLKENSVEKIRHSGRAIEKATKEFSRKKRGAIDKTISTSKKLLVGSFIFLIVSTCIVGCLLSTNVVKTLNTVEKSFGRLKDGDFTQGIDLNTYRAPEEITSFVKTYNQTIDKLGASRAELEHTLKKLEDANKELVEKQDELVEAKKLTAMRLLASEIAHEINNPLSSLTIFLRMFYEDMKTDDAKKEALELMLNEVSRCQSLIRELADFAKKEPMKFKEINPAELIREAAGIVREQNRDCNINLDYSLNSLPEKAMLDPVLIYQALVNILINAYQFTPCDGRIDIEGYTEGNTMTILIRDTGTGINEKNLPYIFEPFFSTRKEIGGSGLGLAITKKIIERHNGSIQVESKLDKETVFKIKLPVEQI
ncbi:MAG: NtrC family signal transduction histidine kinase [Nitrospirae bacterium]|nr:MAG: NtrC family signal transduction histidine kinase [Nitrospirota bacterium]